MPVPSEKSPSLQTNVSLDKNSDSTITKTITGNPLQMPLEKQPAAKSCDTLTTLSAHWPTSQEEFIGPHLRTSKSDSTFRNQASVETLYVSPSFTTLDPMKETVISKGHQKATQSGLVPMEDENLKTLATWGESTRNPSFEVLFFYFFLFSVSWFVAFSYSPPIGMKRGTSELGKCPFY